MILSYLVVVLWVVDFVFDYFDGFAGVRCVGCLLPLCFELLR